MLAPLLSLLLLSTPGESSEIPRPARTEVKDAAAKSLLLGAHRLTLQWISWDKWGRLEAKEVDGVIELKGEQRDDKEHGLLTVEGYVTQVDAKSFAFVGRILTQVSHIHRGEPCLRSGAMTFRISGKRKYWRLKEMDNPCDGVTDYVDIYFEKP